MYCIIPQYYVLYCNVQYYTLPQCVVIYHTTILVLYSTTMQCITLYITTVIEFDPEANRTHTTESQLRDDELQNLVMNHPNLPINKFMNYVFDYYNCTIDYVKVLLDVIYNDQQCKYLFHVLLITNIILSVILCTLNCFVIFRQRLQV